MMEESITACGVAAVVPPQGGTRHETEERHLIARAFGDSSRSGELARLLIRAYRSLYGRTVGDSEKIVQWLQTYNHDLRAIPIDVIKKTNDLGGVAKYLDQIRG